MLGFRGAELERSVTNVRNCRHRLAEGFYGPAVHNSCLSSAEQPPRRIQTDACRSRQQPCEGAIPGATVTATSLALGQERTFRSRAPGLDTALPPLTCTA